MPENFFVAARFASLEQAGEAYTPIQEMLRVEQAAELSVYRFQVGGVSHVVVLGQEPPAQVRAAIDQALSKGEPVDLAEEAVRWLWERRAEGAQPDTFREGHYTSETGPRTDLSRARIRRRRVSTLQVTWSDELPTREDAAGRITDLDTGMVIVMPPQYVGVCDWCTAELAPPVAAIHGFAVELTYPDGFVTATGGKWATCKMCQDRLRLKPGDTQVAFDLVDRLWRIHASRYLGQDARRLRIRTFYQEGE